MSLVTRGRSAGCVAAGRSSVGEPTVHVSRKQADASAGSAETGQQNRMVVGAAGRYRGPAQRECAVPATTASSRRSHNEVDGPAGLRSPESGTGRATKDRLRLARVRSGRLRRRMPGSPLAGNEACSQICAVMTPHLAHLWLSGTTEVLGSGLAISRATKARGRNHPNQQLRPGHLTTTSLGGGAEDSMAATVLRDAVFPGLAGAPGSRSGQGANPCGRHARLPPAPRIRTRSRGRQAENQPPAQPGLTRAARPGRGQAAARRGIAGAHCGSKADSRDCRRLMRSAASHRSGKPSYTASSVAEPGDGWPVRLAVVGPTRSRLRPGGGRDPGRWPARTTGRPSSGSQADRSARHVCGAELRISG
jgi:hypothetical protein